jgi:diguanylate cyclase
VQITLSCGIALLHADDNAQSLFEHADKALYQSKEAGRNAVSIYQSTNN